MKYEMTEEEKFIEQFIQPFSALYLRMCGDKNTPEELMRPLKRMKKMIEDRRDQLQNKDFKMAEIAVFETDPR